MTENMRLIKASYRDLSKVKKILTENNIFLEDIQVKSNYLYILKFNTNIIGFGTVEPYGNIGFISLILIVPQSRRLGYGQNLMQRLIKKAKSMKIDFLYLFTSIPSFFQRIGFKIVSQEEIPLVIQNIERIKDLNQDISKILMLSLE